MNENELILCSIDAPMVINEQGEIDVSKMNDIHQSLGGLVRRIRQIPPGKNTIPAAKMKKGVLFENIHRRAMIEDDTLRFVVYLKDTSSNAELDFGGVHFQLVEMIRKAIAEAFEVVSSVKEDSIYIATPMDAVDFTAMLEFKSVIIKAVDRQDADIKRASMEVIDAMPQGAKLTLYSTSPSSQALNEVVLTKQREQKIYIRSPSQKLIDEGNPFAVEGFLNGHLWEQGKVYIKCSDPVVREKGVLIRNHQDLEKLKNEYCGNRKVTLMIRKDGDRGFQCVSIVASGSE